MTTESLHRVLVADDELPSRQFVCELIKEDPRFRIVAVCDSGYSTIAEASKLQLDVVFLDIQMPGKDGFEALEGIQGRSNPLVVFVTAYGKYALRAFEHEAFDYIEKPINQDRFSRVLDRIHQRLVEKKTAASQMRHEASADDAKTVSPKNPMQGKKLLSAVRQDLVYQDSEIHFVQSAGNYVNVQISDESHLVRDSLENFCYGLESADFVRVHRSFVVNVRSVRRIRYGKFGSAELDLAGGHVVPVSRSRRKEITDVLRRLNDSSDIIDDYVI